MTRLNRVGLTAASLVALTITSGVAQEGGQRASRPPGFTAEAELWWPLPANAQAYGAIEGRRLKDYVNQYTAIARKSRDAGNQFWGVLVGTPADAEAAAWVEAKFKQFGLEVKKQDVNTPTVWSPQSWQVSASSGGTTLKIDSASPITGTPGTSASGVDVEAVWVGTGLPLDFAGKDVRGKAAVIYSNAVPGLNTAATNGAMRRAFEKGAASIIVILATPGNAAGVGIPGQSVNSRGATSNAPVPVQMMVGLKDGTALQEMIEKAAPGQPVRVRVRADIQTKQNVSAPMLMGVLPGMTDENIMVSAHRDSWYEGAQDNASGMSVMVGLAEYFSKIPKEKRRRTMTFVATPEHHSGSNASEWVHTRMKPFLAKTALIINCEHISVTEMAYWTEGGNVVLHKTNAHEATRLFVNGSDRLKSTVTKNLALFGVPTWITPLSSSSGDLSHLQFDAPSLHIIGRGLHFHTTGDTPDMVPASGLESAARAYAKIIDDVNTMALSDLVPPPVKATSAQR